MGYEDAIVAFEEYKKLIPSDSRAETGILSCQQAVKWSDQGSLFALDNAKALNSKKSDYAISYAGKRGKEELTLSLRRRCHHRRRRRLRRLRFGPKRRQVRNQHWPRQYLQPSHQSRYPPNSISRDLVVKVRI